MRQTGLWLHNSKSSLSRIVRDTCTTTDTGSETTKHCNRCHRIYFPFNALPTVNRGSHTFKLAVCGLVAITSAWLYSCIAKTKKYEGHH
jgi:hypothetical protein